MNSSSRILTPLACAAVYLSSLLAVPIASGAEPKNNLAAGSLPAANRLSKVIRSAANRVSPGLVTVYALRGPRMTPPWRVREQAKSTRKSKHSQFASAAASSVLSPDDQGSGIVIHHSGFILTCSHIVAGADAVFVRTAEGRKFRSANVWSDPLTDLAVVRIEGADELQEVQLGNSDEVEVGNWVVSVASPYDLERSVSAGIVSATERWLPGIPHPFIQTEGVLITHVAKECIAYIEGLAAGMAVIRIDDQVIRSLEDYKRVSSELSPEKLVLMLVQSNRSKYLVMIGDSHTGQR